MNLEVPPMRFLDNTPEAQAVESVMAAEHVGIEEAVRTILRKANDKRTPAQRMIGLLSNPEDVAVMDEVKELVNESRQTQTTRDIGL